MKTPNIYYNIKMNKLVLFITLALAAKVHAESTFLLTQGPVGDPAVRKSVLLGGLEATDECSPGCKPAWVGDGECDTLCYNEACDNDAGDCECAPGCRHTWVGDGECDTVC